MSFVSGRARALWLLTGAAFATPVLAQNAAPVTVTPQSLRPEHSDNGFRVDIPEAGGLTAPAGAEGLTVTLADARLEGGFAEVAGQTDAVLAKLHGQRVTLAQIYAVASEIEAIHARAGYVLARVAVPPQDLRDGGSIRILVIDGFVEAVDVSGVPARVRSAVAARTKGLQGRRHVTLADIEQPLLIANEVPGLTLKSTLMRGSQAGGTKIILEGKHHLLSGSIGSDNQLDPSLGRYSVTAQMSVNSALGLGEQIYGFVSSGYDVTKLFSNDTRERVLGGGMVLPIGSGRLTLNPEATFSRTQPAPAAGAPPTLGDLHRFTFRVGYTLSKTRTQVLSLNGAFEQIEESNKTPLFAVTISRDRYMAARLGLGFDRFTATGASYGLSSQVSQGLGNLGALTLADAVASGVGFSRQGADTNFTKLTAQGHLVTPLNKALTLSLSAKGQTSFGTPVFRAEQFSLEGSDGVSAYIGGVTATDEGVVGRAELGTRATIGSGAAAFNLAPYIFAAAGVGSVSQPTALEHSTIRAAGFGAGARAGLPHWGLSFSVEYAHGLSNVAAIDNSDRVNFSTTLRF